MNANLFFEVMCIYGVGLDPNKNLNLPLKTVPWAHFDNGEMKKNNSPRYRFS